MSSPGLQNDTAYDQLTNLLGALLIAMFTAILLGFLLLFGPLRRFTRSSFCNLCLFGSFMAVGSLINIILGKINPSSLREVLIYPEDVSALELIVMYLLILYSGQDNVNALSLEDDNGYKRYSVEFLIINVFFISLAAQSPSNLAQNHGDFGWKISLLWLAMFLKLQERKWAFFYASKAGIARVCRVFADYMKSEHLKDTQEINSFDPATLNGYKYLIEPPATKPLIVSPSCQMEVEPEKIVTLDNVWECDASLLSSDDQHGRLKDLCLSYSYFWLLLRRFAGFTLYETKTTEARDKTWRLIRDGFMNRIDNDRVERAFGVIEIELMFLYDFFYTKYYAAFKGGLAQFIKRSIIVLNIVIISTLIFSWLKDLKANGAIIAILRVVMIAAIILELIQVILLVTSKWCIVKAICYYVKKELWKTQWGWFIGKSVKILTLFPTLKPWRRKLGQYSLLQNYGYNPFMHSFARLWIKTLVDIPRPGQKESKSVKLSVDVKVSLLSSLCINGPKLSNGVETFRRNDVPVQYFSWASELETQAHVILVWHIATSFCEKKIARKLTKTQDPIYKNYKVAKDLSMYCAYLVAFSPELLRDHDDVTKSVFDQVIFEAKRFSQEGPDCCGCDNSKSMFDKMDDVIDEAPGLECVVCVRQRGNSGFSLHHSIMQFLWDLDGLKQRVHLLAPFASEDEALSLTMSEQ